MRSQKIYLPIILAVILSALLCFFSLENFKEISAAIIVAGVSVSFGLNQSKIENDKIFKELFTEFNCRYDRKFNDFFNRIHLGEKRDLEPKDKLLVIDYINMCSEQFMWKQKERIDSLVWKSWEAGMIYNFELAVIKPFISEQDSKGDSGSYYIIL